MLRVRVLGEQTITDDENASMRVRSSRTVALIGFLAAHAGLPQTRQRIAGLFWPDSTDGQALTNLRRELHNLRQIMGDDPSLVVTSRDLCWRDSRTCLVDLRSFQTERTAVLAAAAAGDVDSILARGAAAIGAYQGEFLPGGYDDWALEMRTELERQCADLCDLICDTHAAAGDLPAAVAAARRRVQLQPLEEVGYRTLMRLLADVGDRAGALSTYHHCASVLERELGVVPDAATQDLLGRLMGPVEQASPAAAGAVTAGAVTAGAVTAGAVTAGVVTAGGVAGTSAARRPAGPARLVGRSTELSMLHDTWRMAATGRPGLVLVRGDAGVGKSRLVAELAEVARLQGAVVAATQCFGTPGRLALAPVADWLRTPAVRSAMSSLDPAWRAEVDRLVPSGQGRSEATASSRAMVDAWQRHQFFEGMARALLCAGRPTLLIIDNLQWCDEETLALLAFCLRLDPAAPVLVSATMRDDGADDVTAPKDWIASMRASGLLTELMLAPLGAAETARLAEEISGRPLRPADVSLLHATTGGFPLYIVEAVRAQHDLGNGTADAAEGSGDRRAGPVGDLSAVLRRRLDQVSAPAREVAGLAAAVGTDFTLDLLAEASDLDADTVVEAVDELWRRRIVREFRAGYDFSHDLLRDVAYGQVSPPKRWLLHRRIAQGLELLHPDGADEIAAQLAEQYARGGRAERAIAYYRRAAEVAASLFAHAEAIRLHKKALSVALAMPAGRDRDARELGILEAIAAPLNARYGYASPELERTARRSIELAQALGRKDSTLTGLAALNTSQFVQGRTADSYRTALRAMEIAEPGSRLSGFAHFGAGGAALSLGRPAEALRHLDLAGQEAGGAMSLTVGTRPDVHAVAWKAHAHWLLGNVEAALAACRQAIAMGRSIDHPYSMAVALAYGCVTYQMCDLAAELHSTSAELAELCGRYHFAYYREWAIVLTGWLRGGESGVAAAKQGVANLRAEGSLARMPYWLSLLADLQAKSGARDAARATLDAALITGQSHDDVWWLPEVIRMRASYDETPAAALTRLRTARELASAHGSVALVRRCERDIAGPRRSPSWRRRSSQA